MSAGRTAGIRGGRRITSVLSTTSLLLGCGVASYACSRSEYVKRNLFFWRNAFPIYLHYKYAEVSLKSLDAEERQSRLALLHARYAPRIDKIARELGGFYIKLAQLGSTRTDYLADEYLEVCERLQSDCPSEPFSTIRKIVERGLEADLYDIFEEFEELPLGAASIGQAHRAKLKKDGRPVVVKVQLPDAESRFRIDVRTAKKFCKLMQPAHLPFLNEVEKQFMTEFDYSKEAENMEMARANLLKTPWRQLVCIPAPIKGLCSKKVLVMEYVDGVKFTTAVKQWYEDFATARSIPMSEIAEARKK